MSDGEWPRPEDFFDGPDEAPVEPGRERSATPNSGGTSDRSPNPLPPAQRAREAGPSSASAPPAASQQATESTPPTPPMRSAPPPQAAPPARSRARGPVRPSETARRQPLAADASPVALVPKGGVFEGQVAVVGETRIDGQVNGTLKGPGTLILEPNARIEGVIDCDAIECQGQVMGPVAVRQRARFYGAARLDGDLAAPAVEVQDAALWVGDAKIGH